VSHSPGPRLLAEVSSGVAMCPRALRSAFLGGGGELRCCHVSHGSGLCLPERGAPLLPCVTWPRWTVDHRNKKGLAALGTQLGSHVSKARSCITKAPVDVQAATVHPHSAASTQLTTPGHGYSGGMTQQVGIMGWAMFRVVER
jgi:hypothetical protein